MLSNFAKRTARILHVSGFPHWIRRRLPPQLTILAYHRIRPDGDLHTEFDEYVYGPTQSEFHDQIKWLGENTRVLSEAELVDSIAGTRPLLSHCALVTFDDGYLDNFERAYPILRDLNVPAIFFIPTLCLEERLLGWWDLIAYFVKRTKRPSISIGGTRYAVAAQKNETIRSLQRGVKNGTFALSSSFYAELTDATGVPFPGKELMSRELMTWDQVKELSKPPFSVGSHTHSHPVLSALAIPEQAGELEESKRILESRLGKPVQSVAYPVGGYKHFQPQTKFLAAQAGYLLGFSYQTGLNHFASFDPFDLRRITPPRAVAAMSTALALPGLFNLYRSRAYAVESLSLAR